MPVMTGDELLPHLFVFKPDVRVIVSSGQDPMECMRRLSEPRVASYLQKPYRPDALVGKVQEILAEKGERGGHVCPSLFTPPASSSG
jgi:DNA-binding NarL/FixJ family response regulator